MSIKYLFFECHFAHAVWGCIHITLSFSQPHNISHVFRSWFQEFRKILKPLVVPEQQPVVGRFGFVEIVWCLKKKHFYSYS